MSEDLFQQYVIVLSVSLVGVLLLQRLRMATIVAYMVVGALIGPNALTLIEDPSRFSFVAEFGVVFLLFTLGLEFNLQKILNLRYEVFVVGGVQVLVCTTIFAAAVYLWGTSLEAAVIIAGSLALSSTAIVTRELANNRQLHNLHGQLSIGVLLFQDLVAVIFLVLVPVLGNEESGGLAAALTGAAINTVIVILILLSAGNWLLPRIYNEVAKRKSDEIFVLTTLVIVLAAAWLAHAFNLSMPLGAFIIGMMLGEGPVKYQIRSDIRPFRDILLGLFFVTIGMSLDLDLLVSYWPRIVLFTFGLIAIKVLAVSALVYTLGYGSRDATKVGLNLAQAGEFGLALLALALVNGVVPPDQTSFIILIAIFSMMASPALIRHSDKLSVRIFNTDKGQRRPHPINLNLDSHVIIGGFGRLGSMLVNFLQKNDIPYIAIDIDIENVARGRNNGINVIYGDSNNFEILRHCHLSSAKLVVLTFKNLEEGKAAISRIRQHNADIPIIIRCQEHRNFEELIALGANQVFPELLESSLLITRQVLELLEIDQDDLEGQIEEFMESLPGRKQNPGGSSGNR